jgi:cytochrome c
MDSFELNKIFGAVLATALIVVALNVVVSGFMKPHKSEKMGMEVAVADVAGPATGPAPAEVPIDWGTVLPVADVAAGEQIHARCLQCHDFSKGGPDKIGPNLYGIIGAKHAHAPNYAYSPAMKAAAEKTWGYAEFSAFIKNPKAAIPGTKMAFAGLSKDQDRINLAAYLRTLSDSPLAIPAPNPAAPAPAPTAPAAPGGDGAEPAGEVQAPPPGTAPAAPGPGTTPPSPGTTTPAAPTTTPPAGAAPATPPPATTPPAH